MTKEQVDEIRHAIKKGRPHLAKKLQSEAPPVAVATTGPSGASSSGLRYPEGIRRVPSRNPPVREPAPYQGAMKRVFSDRGSDDPFAPTVRRHREEQAKAAPSVRRNPNVDVRYGDRPTRVTSSPPPRAVPILGTPLGDWIPGVERKTAAARAKAARAAAAALPYADDRRRDPPAVAARDRSLPPRRGPSRGPPEELLVHPDNPRFAWSHLQKMWFPREEPAEMTYRGARSRSPPPRHGRDDQYVQSDLVSGMSTMQARRKEKRDVVSTFDFGKPPSCVSLLLVSTYHYSPGHVSFLSVLTIDTVLFYSRALAGFLITYAGGEQSSTA